MRYFITFACYGARLHGDESGSVDRNHNLVGSRLLELMAERREMLQDPYVLDQGAGDWYWLRSGGIANTAAGTCWPRISGPTTCTPL